MRSRWLITIWPTIHFYSKLTILLLLILTILSKTGPSWIIDDTVQVLRSPTYNLIVFCVFFIGHIAWQHTGSSLGGSIADLGKASAELYQHVLS